MVSDIYQRRQHEWDRRREDRMFSSKRLACVIFAPSLIPLALSFFLLSVGISGPVTLTFICMGSFLGLVSGFLHMFRRKIIQQDRPSKENPHSKLEPPSQEQVESNNYAAFF